MIQNENVLEVIDLTKTYENFTLDKINFNLKKGSITGFIGINGAGKTTTIKSLSGLVIPDSGEINFFGEKINYKNESKIRNKLGFVFDGDYFYPEFTVKQMKSIFSKAYSNWDEKVFKDLIQKFDIPLNQKISTFSKGMKVKFSLSLALSHHAEILIMDEPTSGLDPLVRSEIIKIFKNLAKDGVSILFSSHITSDLEHVADNIILIKKGKIILKEKNEIIKLSHFIVEDTEENLTPEKAKLFFYISKEDKSFKGFYIGDKKEISDKFPNANIEKAKIEDIMLAYTFKN